MKIYICSLLILFLAVINGCVSNPFQQRPTTNSMNTAADLHADGQESAVAETDASVANLTTAEIDSLFLETEDLLDSLGAPVGTLGNFEAFRDDLPDISDSLAAFTEAQLPSVDELFDYPVVVNRRVLSWIDLYQGKAKDTFNRSLKRSGRYLAMARRIFNEEGIPQDLAFLAHIESGFRHNARSPVKALGLWQFMRGTARQYELRCDAYVDQRLDPELSTRASARFMRDLYEKYNDWYLVLAAYNAGPGKVDRAIRRAGTRDFWKMAQARVLVNETRNFVPAILAATILAKSPGAYGYNEETDPPLEYDTVAVDSPTDLRVVAECTGVTLKELQELNPSLLLLQTPIHVPSFHIRVPQGYGDTFAREIAKIPPEKRLVFVRHKVKSGQTLGLLANRYGTTVHAIQQANRMGRKTMIRIGETLLVPSRSSDGSFLASLDRYNAINHKVRRGEFLDKIARSYGCSVREIISANQLSDPSKIYIGQTLVIPAVKRPPAIAAIENQKRETRSNPRETDSTDSEKPSAPQTGNSPGSMTRELRASNTLTNLGRVPTTAHIVEQAREAIKKEQEENPQIHQPKIHVVHRGDTLSEIAARYKVRVSHLRRWNNIRGNIIRPGQELLVKEPGVSGGSRADSKTHVVKRGDSLWKIAKRYGVRVRDIVSWNQLRRNSTIYPGQKLRIN